MAANLRFRGGLLFIAIALTATVASAGAKAQHQPIASGFGKGAYLAGPSIHPTLEQVIEPDYPASALQAGVEGEVLLDAVVGTNGRVKDVRVAKSLNAALDASAVAAVKRWTFAPASIQGKKVAVLVSARATFHLHAGGNTGGNPFTESGLTADHDLAQPAPVRWNSPGVTLPMATKQVNPKYTPDGMHEKIQGVVSLEAVVGVDGRVTSVRVLKSLDSRFGLDDAAIEAARQWRFTPGRRNGVAVPVIVQLELEFRLH